MALDMVTLGEAMVVLNALQTGPLRFVDTFRKGPAGAEFNVAVGLARLGRKVGWVSRVGDDELGQYLLGYLRAEGVDTCKVEVDATAPTGVYFKEWRTAESLRVHYYRSGSAASKMRPEDLPDSYLADAKWLHLTGITPALGTDPRKTVMSALTRARELHLPVSLDPNYRRLLWSRESAATCLREMLPMVTVLLPSYDEAAMLAGPAEPLVLAERLLDMGPEIVVVKAESHAWYATRKGEAGSVPRFDVKVLDPVGAGDAFAVGFLAALWDDMPIDAAVRQGHAVAAICVGVSGDTDGLPTRNELDRFLREQTQDVER